MTSERPLVDVNQDQDFHMVCINKHKLLIVRE